MKLCNKKRLESLLRPEKTTSAFRRLSAPSQRAISRPGQGIHSSIWTTHPPHLATRQAQQEITCSFNLYPRGPSSAFPLLVRGAHHVPYGDAATGPRTLYLGEVHPKLLGLLPGGVRGIRFFFFARLDLGLVLVLLRTLLGDLLYRVAQIGELQVQEASVRSELQVEELSALLRHGTHRVPLVVGVLLLRGELCDVAHYILVDQLAGLVQGSLDYVPRLDHRAPNRLARLVGSLAQHLGARHDALHCLRRLPHRLCGLPDRLPGLVGHLPHQPLGLPRRLPGNVLCLTGGVLRCLCGFPCSVLKLLRCLPRGLRRLPNRLSRGLLGLLDGLVHRVLQALLLSDLVEGVLYGLVGGDHLLKLRPGVLLGFGELL